MGANHRQLESPRGLQIPHAEPFFSNTDPPAPIGFRCIRTELLKLDRRARGWYGIQKLGPGALGQGKGTARGLGTVLGHFGPLLAPFRVVASKGGLSHPRSHHKRVVAFRAAPAASHTPTPLGHEHIGSSGGLRGRYSEPGSHLKRVVCYGWPMACSTAATHCLRLCRGPFASVLPFPKAIDQDNRWSAWFTT